MLLYHPNDTHYETEYKGQALSHDSHDCNNKIGVHEIFEEHDKRKV